MTDEARAEQAIRSTWPDLEDWGRQSAAGFSAPPGSELAADDQAWQWTPLTQLAMGCLGSSRDHLQAVRVHIEARETFPFATDTLVRTAVLAGAQAVWLLHPGDPEVRRARARTLAYETYSKQRQYLAELRELSGSQHEGTEQVFNHITKRREELASLRAEHGESAVLNATDVIVDAANRTLGPGSETEARAVWRAGSGAAHGLSWPMLGRTGTISTAPAGNDGLAGFASAGSLADIVNAYALAYRFAKEGWRLLAFRGQTPQPDVASDD